MREASLYKKYVEQDSSSSFSSHSSSNTPSPKIIPKFVQPVQKKEENNDELSELEKIKIDNKNISLAYKLITLMNGTMVISSDYGIGSKIKIVLDQRVVDNISRKEKQYNEVYNNKKILIVDDSEAGIKIIEKLLKGSNIIIDKAFTGRECLDKIRSKNKYDVILLDEELSQIKGYELLIKLKEIRSFNIPVILLSKDNSYEYNEEYKKLGFSGILIKPIKKEILITNIDKFMKK